MTRNLMISLAALGLFAGGPAASFAAPSGDIVVRDHPTAPNVQLSSKHVLYKDLDISTPGGAETLLSRIKSASKTVCQHGYKGKMSLHERKNQDRCVSGAMRDAVRDLNAPQVTAAYQNASN